MQGTLHAAARAAERFGIIADSKWFREVVDQILSGQAKRVPFITRLDGNPIFDAEVSTGRVRVAFDAVERRVVTVLPPELPVETTRKRIKRLEKQSARRKKDFFRDFQDDEE
jgi:hypothetical protein